MNKCDITIRKEATVNTGNYSSVRPGIEITLKDVNIDKLEKAQNNLSIITAAMFLKELEGMCELQSELKDLGIRHFFEKLDGEEMKEDLKESIKELYEDMFTI
jgi:hypothetical protein